MPAFNRLAASAALVLAGLASLPALADEPRYNQISLHAEVSQEVAHDRMYVTLYNEQQNTDPAKLAEQITASLNQAVERARKVAGVKISLGSRHSYPVYDEEGRKITAWRERAELRLESAEFARLSQLSADLLGDLKMAGMNFAIAEDTRNSAEDALIKQAVEAFKARAQLASEALGGKRYKVVSLNLNGTGQQPVMPMRAMAMDAGYAKSAPAPQVEAGSSRIGMSADGVIEVQLP